MSSIDNIQEVETDVICPHCGESGLAYIPEQSGPCHSGLFIDKIKEPFYWCYSCDSPVEVEEIS